MTAERQAYMRRLIEGYLNSHADHVMPVIQESHVVQWWFQTSKGWYLLSLREKWSIQDERWCWPWERRPMVQATELLILVAEPKCLDTQVAELATIGSQLASLTKSFVYIENVGSDRQWLEVVIRPLHLQPRVLLIARRQEDKGHLLSFLPHYTFGLGINFPY